MSKMHFTRYSIEKRITSMLEMGSITENKCDPQEVV